MQILGPSVTWDKEQITLDLDLDQQSLPSGISWSIQLVFHLQWTIEWFGLEETFKGNLV